MLWHKQAIVTVNVNCLQPYIEKNAWFLHNFLVLKMKWMEKWMKHSHTGSSRINISLHGWSHPCPIQLSPEWFGASIRGRFGMRSNSSLWLKHELRSNNTDMSYVALRKAHKWSMSMCFTSKRLWMCLLRSVMKFQSVILEGLPPEYHLFVNSVTSRADSFSVAELETLLLA